MCWRLVYIETYKLSLTFIGGKVLWRKAVEKNAAHCVFSTLFSGSPFFRNDWQHIHLPLRFQYIEMCLIYRHSFRITTRSSEMLIMGECNRAGSARSWTVLSSAARTLKFGSHPTRGMDVYSSLVFHGFVLRGFANSRIRPNKNT